MSVLLTAGKRAIKPKSAKPKKKRGRSFNPEPPLSSPHTSVWYWELDGQPTTVMLTKESNEVWCNGQIMDTIDGFAEDEMDAGGHIDFCIYIEVTENVHKARIRRVAVGGREGIHHELIVDGDMITEHTTANSHMHLQRTGSCSEDPEYDGEGAEAYPDEGAYMPYPTPEAYQASYPYPAPPDPPTYEESMAEASYDPNPNPNPNGYGNEYGQNHHQHQQPEMYEDYPYQEYETTEPKKTK